MKQPTFKTKFMRKIFLAHLLTTVSITCQIIYTKRSKYNTLCMYRACKHAGLTKWIVDLPLGAAFELISSKNDFLYWVSSFITKTNDIYDAKVILGMPSYTLCLYRDVNHRRDMEINLENLKLNQIRCV